MRITFKLLGVDRVIIQENTHSFTALVPGTNRALGYYSNIQNAVLSHIKDAGYLDENGKEAVMDIKNYVEMHKSLFDEVLGLSTTDIEKFADFKEVPKKTLTEERKAKMQAARIAKMKERKAKKSDSDDDDHDVF